MNTTKYTHADQPAGAPPTDAPRIDDLQINWQTDDDADLSYLEQFELDSTDSDERQYARQDRERLARFGDTWVTEGCQAVARVSYAESNGSRRLETLSSGGLWGIETDSDRDYLTSVENDELADLKAHLERFGVDVSNFDELASDCEGRK
jgi:hypothetical protein